MQGYVDSRPDWKIAAENNGLPDWAVPSPAKIEWERMQAGLSDEGAETMKTDDMGVYLVSGPGQDAIWTALDEWVAASSYGVLVEANAAGLAEIRRRLATADVAVDVVPAPAGCYPDDTEGGVVVHEDGTWTTAQ